MIMTIMTMTTITATNIMTMKNKQIHVQTQIVDATNMNIMTTITATAITMNIMNTKQKQTHAQTQTATATNMNITNTKQKQTHAQTPIVDAMTMTMMILKSAFAVVLTVQTTTIMDMTMTLVKRNCLQKENH